MPYRSLRSVKADARALANYTRVPQIVVQHQGRKTFHVIQANTSRTACGVLIDEFLKKHGKTLNGLELGFQLKPVEIFTA